MSTADLITMRSLTVDAKVRSQLIAAQLLRSALETVGIAFVTALVVLRLGPAARNVGSSLLVIGVITVGGFAGELLRARKRSEVGSVIGCGTDGQVIRVLQGGIDRLTHLSRVRVGGVRGDVVRLQVRRTLVLVPRRLLDDEALAILRAGAPAPSSDAAPLTQAEPLAGRGVVTAADVYEMRRLARRRQLLHVPSLVTGTVVTLVAVGYVLAGEPPRAGLVLVLLLALLVSRVAAVATAQRLILPVGCSVAGDVDRGHWVVATATTLTAMPLSRAVRADVVRGVVVLRWRGPQAESYYPSRLLSDSAKDQLPGLN